VFGRLVFRSDANGLAPINQKKIQSELAKVSASEIGTKEVVSVHKDAVAAEVFKVMSDKNLSGIAVVDSIGTFLCSTQASDLKLYLLKQDLSLLRKPIRQFLAEVRQQELDDLLPNVRCYCIFFNNFQFPPSFSHLLSF